MWKVKCKNYRRSPSNNTERKIHLRSHLHVSGYFWICNFFFPDRASVHTHPALAGAREIWIDQSGFSRWEKIHCPHANVSWQERHWNQATFLIGDGMKYSLKGIYNFQNHFTLQKSEKYETSCVSKLLIWRQIIVRRAWPCRITVVLFWTKCAVRRQIKPGIL